MLKHAILISWACKQHGDNAGYNIYGEQPFALANEPRFKLVFVLECIGRHRIAAACTCSSLYMTNSRSMYEPYDA